ncbi:MAG: RNA polymerase sigma factor [Acidimicrobiales bacterium]
MAPERFPVVNGVIGTASHQPKAKVVHRGRQARQCGVDDAESFEDFFERVMPRSIGVGLRILGSPSDAEDAAVEALARAFIDWERLSMLEHREAWALRVTANVAYDELRRSRRRSREIALPPLPASTDDPDLRLILAPLLARLSRRQREVVVLSHVVGLTHHEIASVLGCSSGSVKVHARRGLAKLRSDLGVRVLDGKEPSDAG